MPAVAVRQREQALFSMIGRKGYVGCYSGQLSERPVCNVSEAQLKPSGLEFGECLLNFLRSVEMLIYLKDC